MTAVVMPAYGTSLTDQELRVLARMALGMTNAQIGRELFLAENTVKTVAKRLFRRLGAHDRANAVWLATVRGILRTPDGVSIHCGCGGRP